MCRFIAYKGIPININKLLYEPDNSLIHQSYSAQEREEPLNGDGFGIGWYNPDVAPNPAVFLSVQPAWNNRSLQSIAPIIETPCLFAHVRAATVAGISETNCHPFRFEQYLMMHNGDIGEFAKIKRRLRNSLSDTVYDWIDGQTDSQHFFAVFLNRVLLRTGAITASDLALELQASIAEILRLQQEAGIKAENYLNLCVTDGNSLVASRFSWPESCSQSTLYYSRGSRYECENGVCTMQRDKKNSAVLVVSEKLTDVSDDWQEVPPQHMVIVESNLALRLQPISL